MHLRAALLVSFFSVFALVSSEEKQLSPRHSASLLTKISQTSPNTSGRNKTTNLGFDDVGTTTFCEQWKAVVSATCAGTASALKVTTIFPGAAPVTIPTALVGVSVLARGSPVNLYCWCHTRTPPELMSVEQINRCMNAQTGPTNINKVAAGIYTAVDMTNAVIGAYKHVQKNGVPTPKEFIQHEMKKGEEESHRTRETTRETVSTVRDCVDTKCSAKKKQRMASSRQQQNHPQRRSGRWTLPFRHHAKNHRILKSLLHLHHQLSNSASLHCMHSTNVQRRKRIR